MIFLFSLNVDVQALPVFYSTKWSVVWLFWLGCAVAFSGYGENLAMQCVCCVLCYIFLIPPGMVSNLTAHKFSSASVHFTGSSSSSKLQTDKATEQAAKGALANFFSALLSIVFLCCLSVCLVLSIIICPCFTFLLSFHLLPLITCQLPNIPVCVCVSVFIDQLTSHCVCSVVLFLFFFFPSHLSASQRAPIVFYYLKQTKGRPLSLLPGYLVRSFAFFSFPALVANSLRLIYLPVDRPVELVAAVAARVSLAQTRVFFPPQAIV